MTALSTGEMVAYARQSCQSQNAIAAMSIFPVTCGALPIDFREVLRRAGRAFRSQQEFATTLGISTARLNRALNKGDYPLNVVNCLKLAELSGESPSAILRAAGKGVIAGLIERLYGRESNADMEAENRIVINAWQNITDKESRRALLYTMRQVASGGAVPPDVGSGLSTAPRAKKRESARTKQPGRNRLRE